jgi:glutamate racemase
MCSGSSRPSLASEAPIGIFDSGIGGLTVAHAIARALPAERLSYFGDTAHMPYGDRSPELVRSWSVRIAEHLLDQGSKAIVIACNSASATAAAAVRDLAGESVPVIDVISPVVRAVAGQGHARIGVIGTRATIGSGIYGRTLRNALRESGCDGVVEEWATPLLAPLIEEGWQDHALMDPVLLSYLDAAGWTPGSAGAIDALIPGCTHYPLAMAAMRRVLSEQVDVVDGPGIVAEAVRTRLADEGLLHLGASVGDHRFSVSDLTPGFERSAARFFGHGLDLAYDPLWA